MSSPFSLIGRIAVIPNCDAQLQVLRDLLEPTVDEFVYKENDKVFLYIDSEDVPFCFIAPARKALFDFCKECATAPAFIQTDDGYLVVGPHGDEADVAIFGAARLGNDVAADLVSYTPTMYQPADAHTT